MRHFFLFLLFGWCVSLVLEAQETDSVPAVRKTKVFLEHANTLSFDKEVKSDAQILVGDVCFRHDSSYMYCDSAYFYEQTNSLEAFSNVRMEQGDTLFVFGEYLFYDGNTQIAYLRDNVRMENRQVTLFTDSLNYERIPDIGYYRFNRPIRVERSTLSPIVRNAIEKGGLHIDNTPVRIPFATYRRGPLATPGTYVRPYQNPGTIDPNSLRMIPRESDPNEEFSPVPIERNGNLGREPESGASSSEANDTRTPFSAYEDMFGIDKLGDGDKKTKTQRGQKKKKK